MLSACCCSNRSWGTVSIYHAISSLTDLRRSTEVSTSDVFSINRYGEVLICPTEDPEWASVGKGQRPFTPNLTNINTVYTVEIPGYVGLGRTMVPRGSELLGLYGTA